MARSSSKQSKAPASRKSSTSIKGKPGHYNKAQAVEQKASILDDRSKRDIVGVVLIVVGLALFVTALIPPGGLIVAFLSTGLHSFFGIGAYILPLLLIALAFTIFLKDTRNVSPVRISIGLLVIFVTILCIAALFTPGAETNPNLTFSQVYLESRGGYCGAALAWVFLRLFGLTVSMIFMIGFLVIGAIIVGFSLSSAFNKISSVRSSSTKSSEFDDPGPMLARMKLGQTRQVIPDSRLASHNPQRANLPRRRLSTQFADHDNAAHSMQTQLIPEAATSEKKSSTGSKAQKTATQSTILLDDKPRKTTALTRKLSDESSQNNASKTQGAPKKKKTPQAIPSPLEGFELPDFSLLNVTNKASMDKQSSAFLKEEAQELQDTLHDFGVDAQVVDWVYGPTVTLFKIDLPPGVRVSKIENLDDDIALALASPGVRVFSPVPGTNYVGVEVPNKKRQTVYLGDVLKQAHGGPLEVAIGKDVEGASIVSDLAKMPHLLIGGTTGSGKSVSINGMIMSILMRATPAEVRFIMIDPKRVEFTPYNGIPHLYVPVVTEPREAASALAWAVAEMERRLKVFAKIGVRNIGQYNAKVQAQESTEDPDSETFEEIPYIVIVIDELADLMMNVGKEVELSISRLAQLARAAGIHLIVATQRPSTKVVTGLIKANITNRIAFNVASSIDSRVILDATGAENLIGLGDLLLSKPELAKPQRIQGCFVSEDEIEAVVEALKEQGEPEYHNDILKTNLITLGDSAPDGSGGGAASSDDPLVWEAAEIVCSTGVGSTSNLQRRLSVGYSRAGRIMDLLEAKGVVGPPNGSKPREVLVDSVELETLKAFEEND